MRLPRAVPLTCAFVGVLLIASPASSQTPSDKVKESFGKLFAPKDLEASASRLLDDARTQERDEAARRSGCTIRVIPADPGIDPRIVVKRDADETRYTVRVIPPPPCK
jgi:hypothetical protein